MSYTAPTVVASGTTFAQFQAGGARGHLEILIAAQGAPPSPRPSPQRSPPRRGRGTLPAATYYVVFTDPTASARRPRGRSRLEPGRHAGQNLVVTFQSLKSGNTSRKRISASSSTGPFTLGASGTTTST